MILNKLYIENFMCHDNSFIDFSQFDAALIVGKIDNNDLYSNGVGKTTIFKAIEYVLFNQSDVNLERIIRDDEAVCKITLDFTTEDQEYRIIRKRNKKGISDFSLFQRTSVSGDTFQVYHKIIENNDVEIYLPLIEKEFWKDMSGRRAGDTEKDLEKLIKINFKAFRNTQYFLQNDLGGIATATPEKRKSILKDVFNLIIYTKLEKIAKEKSNSLLKDIEKYKTLIENLGNPNQNLIELESNLFSTNASLEDNCIALDNLNISKSIYNEKINNLNTIYTTLKNQSSSLVLKERSILNDKNKLENSITEYNLKKLNIIKLEQDLVNEIKTLEDNKNKLSQIDLSQLSSLTDLISNSKNNIIKHNLLIQDNINKYEELKIPVPDDNKCKHCRQLLTEEHKQFCKKQIRDDMEICQVNIKNSKKEIAATNSQITEWQSTINNLNLSKRQLDEVISKIIFKNKEIQDKKEIYDEYLILLTKFTNELNEKNEELNIIKKELENSSIKEEQKVQLQIDEENKKISSVNEQISSLNKEAAHLNATKAVISHNIIQKNKDAEKLIEFNSKLEKLNSDFTMYPYVLQAFSSVGIPNLIIQNVLDDLQSESNLLLSQLKPGLQMSFVVEKTMEKTGDQADTLDIKYHINGKERYYEQLSGAQKLAIAFSLKLGLSFLLNKMIGADIKFLLLDEVDQSLDKASVDAFADIVKFFQKDFTILVITHNDRLKDKFSKAILVSQNIDMVSRAKVVSSW